MIILENRQKRGRDGTNQKVGDIGYKIRLLHNQLHKNMEAKREENEDNLTGMQRWTLGFLKDHADREVYQRDIEEAFSVSRATASNMLAVMERKGLIERAQVSHDAALKTCWCSQIRPLRFWMARSAIYGRWEARLTAGLSEEDVEHLEALLGSDATKSGCDNSRRHKMLL